MENFSEVFGGRGYDRERIARSEGYDTVTACELAADLIERFRASGERYQRFTLGKASFALARVPDNEELHVTARLRTKIRRVTGL